jgi:hypothetical protein
MFDDIMKKVAKDRELPSSFTFGYNSIMKYIARNLISVPFGK